MKKILITLCATLLLLPFALSLTACGPKRAANRDTLPEDNVTQCRSLCDSAGARLSSVVIVGNLTGCVCEFPQSYASEQSTTRDATASSVSGGAVAVMLANQQRQQQQRP